MDIFAPLVSLFGPFLLWPIEFFLPYPYIVEEVAKGIIVWYTAEGVSFKNGLKIYFLSGFLFALTESVIYSININIFGSISLFFIRLGTSTLLHSLTFVLIFWGYRKSKAVFFVCLVLSGAIHFLYNKYI